MELKVLLVKKRKDILKKWFRIILEDYETYAVKFLSRTGNQFKNPVGHAISKGIEELFDQFVENRGSLGLASSFNNIIKIRAVQDMPPSKAVGFVLKLKKVLRDVLAEEIIEYRLFESIYLLELEIDKATLFAFDQYLEAKKKLFEIRINEIKAGMFSPFRNHGKKLNRAAAADTK